MLFALGLILIAILIVFNLIIVKDVGIIARIGLCAFGLIASLATLFASKTTRTDYLSIAHWKKLKSISIGIGAFVAGLSAIALVLPFVSPSVDEMLSNIAKSVFKTEETAKSTEAKVDKISKAVGIEEENSLLKEVNGIWGRPGCKVTYDILIKQNSLSMTSLKSDGLAPFQSIGTITGKSQIIGANAKSVLINTTTENGEDRGKSYDFIYEDNGAIKRLKRVDKSRGLEVSFDYCG